MLCRHRGGRRRTLSSVWRSASNVRTPSGRLEPNCNSVLRRHSIGLSLFVLFVIGAWKIAKILRRSSLPISLPTRSNLMKLLKLPLVFAGVLCANQSALVETVRRLCGLTPCVVVFCGVLHPTSELRAAILSPSSLAFYALAVFVAFWFWQ